MADENCYQFHYDHQGYLLTMTTIGRAIRDAKSGDYLMITIYRDLNDNTYQYVEITPDNKGGTALLAHLDVKNGSQCAEFGKAYSIDSNATGTYSIRPAPPPSRPAEPPTIGHIKVGS